MPQPVADQDESSAITIPWLPPPDPWQSFEDELADWVAAEMGRLLLEQTVVTEPKP